MRLLIFIIAAAFGAALCFPAAAVGRDDARPSVETSPPPPADEVESPLDNVTKLNEEIETGKWTPSGLAALFAAGVAANRAGDVAEVAEVALGTPASVREAAAAERAAAARAEERRTGEPPEETPASIPEFHDGIAAFRADARVWNEAGVAYYLLNRAGDAAACFKTALTLDAAFDDPHANLGLLYRRKGWYEKALAEYDAALAAGPTNPTTWYNRGAVLLRLGRLQDAVASFETANKLAPTYPPPVKRLALIWYDLGDYKTAYSYGQRLSYLLTTDEAATADEKKAAAELLALCENRIEGRKIKPALTVEGTAAPPPTEKPAPRPPERKR